MRIGQTREAESVMSEPAEEREPRGQERKGEYGLSYFRHLLSLTDRRWTPEPRFPPYNPVFLAQRPKLTAHFR